MQDDLADAIGAQEEEILRAIAKASETGTDSEEPVKFSVTLRGVLNLDANTVETAFSFATRTSVKEKHALEDPQQPKLPLEEDPFSYSKELPKRSAQLSAESFRQAIDARGKIAEKIEATIADAGLKQGKDGVYRREEGE